MLRRTFLGRLLAGFLALAASACAPLHYFPLSSSASDTRYVGKTRLGRFKRFYIQYLRPFRRIKPEKWELKVGGLVEQPISLKFEALRSLPRKVRTSRLKCVECWSARAEWEGFSFSEIVGRVRPKKEAVGVLFRCADSYEEFLSLEDLLNDRTILAYRMNGGLLPDEHGFPLRVIVPFKYGYKSPKAILEMEFVEKETPGTWSRIGPYSVDGTILPGYDTPLDGDGKKRRISGGEIFD